MPEHYGARFFGEREAAVYDDLAADMFDAAVVTPVVETLAGLAGEGRALEFGIGTGRIALPLATRVDGQFSLVYLVFNTIFNLITQDEQVACFQNAARHLDVGGRFVVELVVPDLQRLPPGQNISVIGVDARAMSFDVYDVVTQRLTSHHFVVSEERISSYPVKGRYAWPSELDLMALLAELSLHERWGGWKREPFTSLSRSHVSVYEKS